MACWTARLRRQPVFVSLRFMSAFLPFNRFQNGTFAGRPVSASLSSDFHERSVHELQRADAVFDICNFRFRLLPDVGAGLVLVYAERQQLFNFFEREADFLRPANDNSRLNMSPWYCR
tara:strand:- start:22569 stop:22922 length:354 start_codon:yes stop_codon:yes gene_type:complete